LILRPASYNAQFMRPVTINRFPTPAVIESDVNVNVSQPTTTFKSFVADEY